MKLPLYLKILLGVTLLGCVYLFFEGNDTPSSVPAKSTKASQKLATTTPRDIPALTDRPDNLQDQPLTEKPRSDAPPPSVNLFPTQTWAPPPPPPPPVITPAPSVPQAPPMPFKVTAEWADYEGDQAHKVVVLDGLGQSFVLCTQCEIPGRIRPGETFAINYRLDELTPTEVKLTYLPLKQAMRLSLVE